MKTYHKNPRTISERQFEDLGQWLYELGDLGGIVHDLNSDEVIGGNQRGRVFDIFDGDAEIVIEERLDEPDRQGTVAWGYVLWEGAKYGYRQVRWTAEQAEKANIVANRAGGAWDFDILANAFEVDSLLEWGFEPWEFGIEENGNGAGDGQDAEPQVSRSEELHQEYGTAVGQIWKLGEHRLAIGDCTDAEVVQRLLGGDKPLLMVTDPPYGVGYDPDWRNEAAAEGKLAYAARRVGVVYNDDRTDWSEAYNLFPGDVAYTWSPPGDHVIDFGRALIKSGFQIRNMLMWRKPHFPISRGHYTYQHEPCWYAVRKGKTARWIGNANASTVWDITLDKNVEGGHSTQKPLECMARPIRNHDASVVYDPFVGSGTTIIAAHNLNRRCLAVEIDPGYAAVSIKRWEDVASERAVCVSFD